MKSFRIKKNTNGQHYKIFIRNKLPKPKATLILFRKVHAPAKTSVVFGLETI